MRKARVFPDPVLAAPKTSFPASSDGMHFSWTAVIVEKPMSARALVVGSDKSSMEKGFRWVAPSVEDWAGSVIVCGSVGEQPQRAENGGEE